jgi:hypothetical protein
VNDVPLPVVVPLQLVKMLPRTVAMLDESPCDRSIGSLIPMKTLFSTSRLAPTPEATA